MKTIRRWKIKVANFKKQEDCNKCTDSCRAASVRKVDAYKNVAARLEIIPHNRFATGAKAVSIHNSTALINVISDSKVVNFWKVGNLFNAGNSQKLVVVLCCCLFICCSSGKSNTAKENMPASSLVTATPPCIQKMIDSATTAPGGQSITEVTRYMYNGAKVYLVGAPCCDQFNNAYDSACNYLFAPSGGFTGKGDGSHPDFFTMAKVDSLIWKAAK